MDFAAVIHGKTVYYPKDAKFIVEQRPHGRRKYSLTAMRENIGDAVAKFSRVQVPGTTTRLSAVFQGRIKHLTSTSVEIEHVKKTRTSLRVHHHQRRPVSLSNSSRGKAL